MSALSDLQTAVAAAVSAANDAIAVLQGLEARLAGAVDPAAVSAAAASLSAATAALSAAVAAAAPPAVP